MAFTDSGPEIVLLGRKSGKESETQHLFELLVLTLLLKI
jgi:hypothetical protein